MRLDLRMNFFVILWTIAVVGVSGCGVESAIMNVHLNCEGDYQCPDGFYCVTVSQLCTKCADCSVYKRKSSWRSCPKDPADCGTCLPGFEEEILAGGRTRDICVKSLVAYPHEGSAERIRARSGGVVGEHYLLLVGMIMVLIPALFYVYFRKHCISVNVRLGNSRIQNSLTVPCEEPPPYHSSIELTPLRSPVREEERCCCEHETSHVLNVQQKEETLVQAVPFRQPQYEQNLSFIPSDDEIVRVESDAESDHEERRETNLELEDESTMPSEWTPLEEEVTGELVPAEREASGEECEPSNKRRRKEEDSDGPDNNRPRPINLIINNNNNITINKFV